IRWERWREVRSVKVAGRRTQRCEGGITNRRGVAIAGAGRASSLIGLTDARDGAPEIVIILRFPDRGAGVGHRYIHQCQEPRQFDFTRSQQVGDLDGDLVVQAWRSAQAWRSVVRPVDAGLRSLYGALRRCDHAIAVE